MVAQTRLVVLPGGGKTFVETPKRMTGPSLDQCTETVEGATKGSAVDACSAHPAAFLPGRSVVGWSEACLGNLPWNGTSSMSSSRLRAWAMS